MDEEGVRYAFGGWQVRPDLHLLQCDGVEHHLEPRAMDVLTCLLRRPGELVTTEALLEEVWAGRAVEENAVQQRISRIRRLLEDDARRPRYIETISRKGYRTIAEVRRIVPRPDADAAGPPRLLVLPFTGPEDGTDIAHLREGLGDDLRTRLARTPGLTVIARTSSAELGARGDDAEATLRRLGVTHRVEGRLRATGATLRLTVELVDVRTRAVLWADVIDCRDDALASVEARIARGVLGALGIATGAAPEGQPLNAEAYAAFLRGRQLHHKYMSSARAELERALALEPDFAAAHAAMAWTWIDEANAGREAASVAYPRAQASVARALANDPTQLDAALANSALITVMDRQHQDAVDRIHGLLVRDDSNERALLVYIVTLIFVDRIAEALEVAAHWVEVDPLNPMAHRAYAGLLLKGPSADVAAAERAIRIIESLTDRTEHLTRFRLALHRDDRPGAIELAGALAEEAGGPLLPWYRLRAALLADDRTEAARFASAMVELPPGPAQLHAYAWLVLGEPERAYERLDQGLMQGQIPVFMALRDHAGPLAVDPLPWIAKAPEFEPLRRAANLDDASLARIRVPRSPF